MFCFQTVQYQLMSLQQLIRIATRGSDLALWQAKHVQKLLLEVGLESELKIIKTQGDKIQHLSLDKLEGKGFFTKEIEDALLNNEADIAVHSHKDLPTEISPKLLIAAVSDREDPSELLLIQKESVDKRQKFFLKMDAVIGTSSARRKAQLMMYRPDVELKDLRGNVPTRIQKLRDKNYDAILIAAAGVERLGLDLNDFHVEKLSPTEFIPAPAQGVLAIQTRRTDRALIEKIKLLNNTEAQTLIAIERKVLNLFHGGCQMPVGVYATYNEEEEKYSVCASKANAWNEPAVMVFASSATSSGLAEKVVSKIQSVKPVSVFITRNQRKHDFFFNSLKASGFETTGQSLIEIKEVEFKNLPSTEWIFFSSKHAVEYFFTQKPNIANQKFGCVGKVTADALRKFNHRASYIGQANDTRLIGKQFAAKVGSEKVLFPMAKGSMRSIQQQLVKQGQAIDLIVYETIFHSLPSAPNAEVIVFTSPSNVESYFKSYTFDKIKQKAIAMGDATANALSMKNIIAAAQPDEFTDAGLVRAVMGLGN